MLILLISAWLLGGGSSSGSSTVGYVDQITSYAKGHLPDEAQRKAVLEAAGKLKKAGSEEAKATAQAAKAIDKIAMNRRAMPPEFQDALSEMRGYSEELQAKTIEQRSKLKYIDAKTMGSAAYDRRCPVMLTPLDRLAIVTTDYRTPVRCYPWRAFGDPIRNCGGSAIRGAIAPM